MISRNLSEPEHILYWHDTGHAQIKHQFGLLDHRDTWERWHLDYCGFHLHDVSEAGHDHQIPGTGTIDFKMIADCPPGAYFGIERSPRLTAEEAYRRAIIRRVCLKHRFKVCRKCNYSGSHD